MANQHTKKAEQKAKRAAARKKKPSTEEAIKKRIAEKYPDVKVFPVTAEMLQNFLPGLRGLTPLMNKCDEKAKSVPHFTLLPSDNFTPVLVKEWIRLALEHGVPEEKLLEAKVILKNIEAWRTSNPTKVKTPD